MIQRAHRKLQLSRACTFVNIISPLAAFLLSTLIPEVGSQWYLEHLAEQYTSLGFFRPACSELDMPDGSEAMCEVTAGIYRVPLVL